MAFPLIFFHWGSYSNNSLGTFQYHLILYLYIILTMTWELGNSYKTEVQQSVCFLETITERFLYSALIKQWMTDDFLLI
jgi:hypothetical protein